MKFYLKIKNYKNYITVFLLIVTSVLLLASYLLYQSYKNKELRELERLSRNTFLNKTVKSVFDSLNPRFVSKKYQVKSGDNFEKILSFYKIDKSQKKIILKKLGEKKNLLNLKKNQEIKFLIDYKDKVRIKNINFILSKSENLFVKIVDDNEEFIFEKKIINLEKKYDFVEARIKSSLYSSAIKNSIPAKLIIDFARIYGFEIDFQRDIWKNDRFQIIFEKFMNENKQLVDTGNIIYANLVLKGKEYPLYFFKSEDAVDYYDERGQSIKKTLMKTPINGARLSSKFGKRKHPILGFTKMHTGTDFAAPKGTPIMASGDGVVIKASWCGGGGNCVKIKHNSTYSTVYAHLSKFGRNIKKGSKVKQGQIIGYVGSTGMSTGPHLHYEVIENGKKINSQTLKLPSGKTLEGKERKQFEIVKLKTNVLKSNLIFEKK